MPLVWINNCNYLVKFSLLIYRKPYQYLSKIVFWQISNRIQTNQNFPLIKNNFCVKYNSFSCSFRESINLIIQFLIIKLNFQNKMFCCFRQIIKQNDARFADDCVFGSFKLQLGGSSRASLQTAAFAPPQSFVQQTERSACRCRQVALHPRYRRVAQPPSLPPPSTQ